MSEEKWFVAQVKPNAYQMAQRNLKRQAFKTFLPLQEITKRQSNRFTTKFSPLFPGYIFVRFDPNGDKWRKINSTMGIAKLVSFGTRPVSLPDDLITILMTRYDTNNHLQPIDSLKKGQDVTILSGPFADFVAIVESIEKEHRVSLLLNYLGQKTKIKLNIDQLR